MWEGYEAKLATAKTRGEISVVAGALGGAAPAPLPADARRTPRSAYNPAVSADGRYVAFESAEGNLNFAKRYGQMRVYVTDRDRAHASSASLGIDFKRDPHSAYNPSLSADGRVVAYETSESKRGALDVWVTRPARAARVEDPAPAGVTSDLYEPSLSPDGRFLAFTALTGAGSRASSCAISRPGDTVQVSDGGSAWEPVVSARRARGRVHARRPRRGARLGVGGASTVVAPPAASASASEPSLSRRRARAWRSPRAGRASRHGRLRPRPGRRARRCSPRAPRGAAGPPAFGGSSHPSLSRRRHARRVHLRRLEPLAGQVQPGARDLRPRPRARDDDAGLARGRRSTAASARPRAQAARARCGSRSSALLETPSSSSEL